VIQSWGGWKENQSLEQFFVVTRENSIISVFDWGCLGGAVQIVQRSPSVTLDRCHDFKLLDLVLMLAAQPLLVHMLVTRASNRTDLKEAFL